MAVSGRMKRRRKKRYLTLYTTGELNKIVDSFIHPFFGNEDSYIILDGALHALLEKDFPMSAEKFIRYNLPQLLRCTGKKLAVKTGPARKPSKK
jgi:hypothetical protein